MLILLLLPTQLLSQTSDAVLFKSALLYNLLRNVNWPQESEFNSYTIAMIGDDVPLMEELRVASGFVKVKNLPVKILKIKSNQLDDKTFDPATIQLLFIAKNKAHLVHRISNYARKSDTLLVTEESQDQRDFMINIYPDKKKYKFEVNSSNIIFEGLTLHKDILLLGGTQLDIAKLLRSSEDSLQQARLEIDKNLQVLTEQQAKIDLYQNDLIKLEAKTAQHRQDSNLLKNKLIKQNKEFKIQQKKLRGLTGKTENISEQLSKSLKDLNEKKAAFQLTANELDAKKRLLNESQQKMSQLKEDIAKHSAILLEQKQAITNQHDEIAQKDSQLDFHKGLLTIIISVFILFMLMSVVIYYSFKSKKRAQENLINSYENIKTIGQLGLDITACLDFNQAMVALYSHVQHLMDTSIFAIGLLNEETQSIDCVMAYGLGEKYGPYSRSLQDKNQFSVYCLENNKCLFINDVEEEFHQYVASYQPMHGVVNKDNATEHITPQSMLYVPIVSKNKVKGIITVQSEKKFAYSETNLDLLKTLAAYTSVALDNSLSHEKIKQAQEHLVMQEKMASLGLLTAGVAHEINNPTNFTRLSAQNLQADLKGFKALLLELGGDDLDSKVSALFDENFIKLFEKIDIILDGTQRIKNTVQDLRSFTRQESSEKCVVNLNETLDSTIRLVRSKYQDSIEITHEYIDEPQLDCWPALLNQVFMNIIVNGCDAINEMKSKDSQFKGVMNITLSCDADKIIIQFKDNGSGMSEKTQKQIFEPFYSTKEMDEGTGLGLSISYGIIKKHHGEITLESNVGEGSCFTLSLPYL